MMPRSSRAHSRIQERDRPLVQRTLSSLYGGGAENSSTSRGHQGPNSGRAAQSAGGGSTAKTRGPPRTSGRKLKRTGTSSENDDDDDDDDDWMKPPASKVQSRARPAAKAARQQQEHEPEDVSVDSDEPAGPAEGCEDEEFGGADEYYEAEVADGDGADDDSLAFKYCVPLTAMNDGFDYLDQFAHQGRTGRGQPSSRSTGGGASRGARGSRGGNWNRRWRTRRNFKRGR